MRSVRTAVVGGAGLVGAELTAKLEGRGHDVVSVSRRTGADALTGTGLGDALAGREVLIDVINSPSFEAGAVMEFFISATTNLLAASARAGVEHYVALSVVGVDRATANDYQRAKLAQELLIREGDVPFSILRATQFHEFIGDIVEFSTNRGEVEVPAADMSPVAVSDVVSELLRLAELPASNAVVELAGPETMSMRRAAELVLRAADDDRVVTESAAAPYFGAILERDSLIPGPDPLRGQVSLRDWLGGSGVG